MARRRHRVWHPRHVTDVPSEVGEVRQYVGRARDIVRQRAVLESRVQLSGGSLEHGSWPGRRAAARLACEALGPRPPARTRARTGMLQRPAVACRAACVEKLAWSSRPRDTTALPRVTGRAAWRSCASASCATYSRIITPGAACRARGEERRKVRHRRLDQIAEPSGRQLGHVVDRRSRLVQRDRDVGRVEVGVVEHVAGREGDQRVLRLRVDLDLEDALQLRQAVQRRPLHLGERAQAEGILDPAPRRRRLVDAEQPAHLGSHSAPGPGAGEPRARPTRRPRRSRRAQGRTARPRRGWRAAAAGARRRQARTHRASRRCCS